MAINTFPVSNGEVLDADTINYLNDIGIEQIYTGTGYDSSASSGATDEEDHELDAVSSTTRSYVKISMVGTYLINENNGTNQVELKAQIKETGESYGDIEDYNIVAYVNGTNAHNERGNVNYVLVATLTAGMKANGYQIKVFSKSTAAASGDDASFTNIQTVVEEI